MSLNKVMLIGNVCADPIIRTTQSGNKVASFNLATSERWKDKSSGEAKEKTEFHRVVVFSNLTNVIENYVKKGSKLFLEGSLQTRKWEKEGVDRYTTEIVLQGFGSKIEMLDKRDSSEKVNKVDSDLDISDDIPF